MTREESIQVLQTALTSPFIYGEYADAINMAIEALSDHSGEAAEMVKKDLTRLKVNVQDANNVHNLHSGDLISRADVIETVLTYFIPRSHTGERGEHEEDFVRTVFNALPSAEAEWIPCSERLPNESGKYLVRPSDGVLEDYSDFSEVMIMPYDADCEAFGWWIEQYDPISLGFVDSDFNEFEVLAWMPLPKPYREDGE